jgi:predicted RNA binding protein YcfA (HicA-like mRNA interferase family)
VKLPRDLSDRDLARVLCARWAYRQVNQVGSHQVNQVGSHIALQTETPQHHRVSIPDHSPLCIGTLNAILRQVAAAKGVAREDIPATLS